MKNIKKALAVLICLAIVICAFTACASKGGDSGTDAKKLNIVCTVFPEYDWVMQVLGDKAENADVTLLLDNGVDLHNYQPTAQDIIKISSCDLFIYVGGESDGWVDDTLAEAKNQDMAVINLMETLGTLAKEEEIVEGMEAEEEEAEEAEEAEEGPEYDEHVWLSLKNAQLFVSKIAVELGKLDADNKAEYIANSSAYSDKLSALDDEYTAAVEAANYKYVLFGDRFPFRYLVDDYGLSYYAAFIGCSAETEASFETVSFLAGKVDELGLPAVFAIEGTDHSLAETIIGNTSGKNAQLLVLDSMQSTTAQDIANGASYLAIMQQNLEVLKQGIA